MSNSIESLFQDSDKKYINVCAPMVRYSKLEFRMLVRRYNVDLCFTPMILAESFHKSESCRQNEFSTNFEDRPLVCQFAATNSIDLLKASEAVAPFVDGIDINCGCPQKWAIKMGIGSALLKNPEKMADFVSTVKRNIPNFSVSTKLRILDDSKKSVELARRLEHCGTDFITIHGRTPSQKSESAVKWNEIKLIKESIQIPVIGNGGVNSVEEADKAYEISKCDGIMVANGILMNPGMFAGFDKTPLECISLWLKLAKHIRWQLFQHHLSFMTERYLDRNQRIILNDLKTNREIFNYINDLFDLGLNFDTDDGLFKEVKCEYPKQFHSKQETIVEEAEFTDGKYFKEKFSYLYEDKDTSFDLESIFG